MSVVDGGIQAAEPRLGMFHDVPNGVGSTVLSMTDSFFLSRIST